MVTITTAAAAATKDDNQDAGKDMDGNNQDAGKDMHDNHQDASKDMAYENQTTVKAAAGSGAAGATGLDVVLYDGLKVEGLIVGGVTVQKHNIIQLENLNGKVVQKTANIVDSMQSMDIYTQYKCP